jgi:hypothetical protein
MKTGITLTDLAMKIEGNKALKADYVAPSKKTAVTVQDDGVVAMEVADAGTFPILRNAERQIADRLKIPMKYADRMRKEEPRLYANNVNTWLAKSEDNRMLRTLGGDLRAYLSDRYQRIENEEVAEVALPILADIPDLQIKSCELTENRMYIQAVTPRIEMEVKRGDAVQAGIVISNSEVGLGAVNIQPMIYRLVCLNGMIAPDKFQARHVGRQVEEGSLVNYADDTREADDKAILLKIRDHVRAAVDETIFNRRVVQMQEFAEAKIEGNPVEAVEQLAPKVNATEDEKGGILRSLIEGGDLSAWGLMNAVTAQAHTSKSYDRSVELEAAGGKLLDLPKAEWTRVLEAA